ncbi:MAG: hypothetical protein H7A23_03600 [Leptospiraceae bacterium]|nr:hypothetical protein [Leptospiraceae bacterium]
MDDASSKKNPEFRKKSQHFIDIFYIKESLNEVQKNFSEINSQLTDRREDLNDTVKDNMISAYRYLNRILYEKKDIFLKDVSSMLELNYIVLCGVDMGKRIEANQYLNETQHRFYDFVKPIIKWYKKHKDESPLKVASEIYVGVLSRPQLFFEGNHRTGSLIVSYILVKAGYPPFVLNVKNAVAYFEPSSMIKFTDKRELSGKLKLPKYKKSFKKFLEEVLEPTSNMITKEYKKEE